MLPVEVLIQIFSYLSHKDQLRVRHVCKKWKTANAISRFQMTSKLILSERNFDDFVQYLRTRSITFCIYHLELEYFVCNRNDLKFVIDTIGPNIHSLLLPIALAYKTIYTNLCNLKKLHLDMTTYNIRCEQQNICEIFNFKLLSKLNAIELKCNNNHNEKLSTIENLQVFENVNNLNLQHFLIDFVDEQMELALLRILKTNAATLKSLHLTFVATPLKERISDWSEVFKELCNLNTLKLSGKCSFNYLCAVFDSLPAQANLSHIDLSGIVYVNGELLAKIMHKWSDTLQYLELMFCIRIADGRLNVLNVSINNLLVLNLAYCSSITSNDLLEAFNKENRTLTEINLTDLQQLDEESICILAQRLPNIKVLHLGNVRGVTDKVLAFIFHFQKCLITLVLDDCHLITDDGLVGSHIFEDTIASLQRLEILSLRNCRKLTDRSLQSLRLENMKCLKLCYCHRISKNGLERLTLNCPSIETLYVSSCPKLTDEAILVVAQNLRHLHCLNISNCYRLTELTVDHIVTYCKSLKHLIIHGFVSWNFNDIKCKLRLKLNINLIET